MEFTRATGAPKAGADDAQYQARARKRYLKLVESLKEPESHSAPAREGSLRHCQALLEEYQQAMRMIVRPVAAAGLK
jgi:hypothetical protein